MSNTGYTASEASVCRGGLPSAQLAGAHVRSLFRASSDPSEGGTRLHVLANSQRGGDKEVWGPPSMLSSSVSPSLAPTPMRRPDRTVEKGTRFSEHTKFLEVEVRTPTHQKSSSRLSTNSVAAR